MIGRPPADLGGDAAVALGRILAAVDGARWVWLDRGHYRLFVWVDDPHVDPGVKVYNTFDGECLGWWPFAQDVRTPEMARDTVMARVAQGHWS